MSCVVFCQWHADIMSNDLRPVQVSVSTSLSSLNSRPTAFDIADLKIHRVVEHLESRRCLPLFIHYFLFFVSDLRFFSCDIHTYAQSLIVQRDGSNFIRNTGKWHKMHCPPLCNLAAYFLAFVFHHCQCYTICRPMLFVLIL